MHGCMLAAGWRWDHATRHRWLRRPVWRVKDWRPHIERYQLAFAGRVTFILYSDRLQAASQDQALSALAGGTQRVGVARAYVTASAAVVGAVRVGCAYQVRATLQVRHQCVFLRRMMFSARG